MKRHSNCANCGYSYCIFGGSWKSTLYCEINNEKIEYPRKMGGRNKCPCYITKAEYKKEKKRKIIENHVYPQKRPSGHFNCGFL